MGDIEVTGAGTVEASVGDTVTVRLAENATTGYVWSLTSLGDGLSLEDEQAGPIPDPAPGSGGVHQWRLRASHSGEWFVDLRLARSWEDGAAEECRVRVIVG